MDTVTYYTLRDPEEGDYQLARLTTRSCRCGSISCTSDTLEYHEDFFNIKPKSMDEIRDFWYTMEVEGDMKLLIYALLESNPNVEKLF
ncbi:hypothetical protein BRIZO_112 [Vibrio phage Brizo]|uniref:Uncharacterized protein n=1 Tax=Vibrio phage Brizo TaxID=2590896 RepID=A0A4Y6EIT0_9CAUD|nr:hypothetical protein KNU58_gp170 [Vibrio phage Brizo]QDF14513.1 hypothetical protein BRIZO_112 [Vibrio phage Brizo]